MRVAAVHNALYHEQDEKLSMHESCMHVDRHKSYRTMNPTTLILSSLSCQHLTTVTHKRRIMYSILLTVPHYIVAQLHSHWTQKKKDFQVDFSLLTAIVILSIILILL